MVALAGEIAQGAVWANAARSHMPASLAALPAAARADPSFFIGNMIPTCIDADRAAAAAVNRRTLTSYVKLPNYQNYWIEAGFEDEMLAIRKAIAERRGGADPGADVRPLAIARSRCTEPPPRCATASRPGARPASRR